MIPWWSLLVLLPAVFYAGACVGRWLNADGDWRLKSLEATTKRMVDYADGAMQRSSAQETATKAMLYESWKTMAGQSRGLQRQRRIIVRLREQLKKASA